jgi:hypothetical protein
MSLRTKTSFAVVALMATAAMLVWRHSISSSHPPAADSTLLSADVSPCSTVLPGHPPGIFLSEQLRVQAQAAADAPDEGCAAAWTKLVQSFSLPELPELLRTLTPATDAASVELQQLLLRRWAANDPWAAAGWASTFADPAVRMESVQQVALVWGQTDLTQAIKWMQQLPEEQRQSVCLALAYEAARTDPQTALTLAADLPASRANIDLITHAAAQWAVSDPAAAAQWAGQVTEVSLRNEVLSSIATEWGETDPVAAANLALKSISAGKAQDDAVIGIVQRWAQLDPQSAARWILTFPEGDFQSAAIENLIKPWAAQDSQQAQAWVNSLAPGIVRNVALAAYTSVVCPREEQ